MCIRDSASVDTDTAKQLTFGAVAAQVYANEQARVERGEYGAGSLRMFRNRLDAQILPAIGAKYIDEITYQLLLLFAQSLSAKFSTTAVCVADCELNSLWGWIYAWVIKSANQLHTK